MQRLRLNVPYELRLLCGSLRDQNGMTDEIIVTETEIGSERGSAIMDGSENDVDHARPAFAALDLPVAIMKSTRTHPAETIGSENARIDTLRAETGGMSVDGIETEARHGER